jgi:nitroimidazol reductase NimA-like FMN-containing flavoprotein (pyridoxamine 5'-phosphate oxidase superfamily)
MSDRAGQHSGSTVQKLTAPQCLERLAAATVGRVGYVNPHGLQIIPVNYRLAGSTLMLATTPGSSLAQLGEMGGAVAFEVDYHGLDFNLAWSVLMHGPLRQLDDAGRQRLAELRRPLLSWLGESATLHVEFVPQDFSGRVLQHHGFR